MSREDDIQNSTANKNKYTASAYLFRLYTHPFFILISPWHIPSTYFMCEALYDPRQNLYLIYSRSLLFAESNGQCNMGFDEIQYTLYVHKNTKVT